MSGKGPPANPLQDDLVFYRFDSVIRDKENQLLEPLFRGYRVFYHPLPSSPWLYIGRVKVVKIARIPLHPRGPHPTEMYLLPMRTV